MSRKLAVIVHPTSITLASVVSDDIEIPWGYQARVVDGTIARYNPRSVVDLWRPTAAWARSAGDAWIRRHNRRRARENRREQRARRATGYEENTR